MKVNTSKVAVQAVCTVCLFLSVSVEAEETLCPGASYSATIPLGKSETVLEANVVLPTTGYSIRLQSRPEKIIPPMYNLLCTPPTDLVNQVETAYTITTNVVPAGPGDLITVFDQSGGSTVYVSKECGGAAGTECDLNNEFCHFEPGTCHSSPHEIGHCLPRPSICTEEYVPVLGCDNIVYSNSCHAAAAGTSVAKILINNRSLGGIPWPWNPTLRQIDKD